MATGPQQTASWFVPSKQQQTVMDLALPGIQQFAAQGGVTPYAGPTVAGFDPAQTQGQESILGAVPGMQQTIQGAANTHGFWTGGDVWNPQTNEMLQGAQEAATRPIIDNFLQSVLPALRSDAIMSGGYGGSALAKGENLATATAARQVGDTSAQLVNNLYNTNVNAQLAALRETPQMLESYLAPGRAQSAVGDVRQAHTQAELDAARNYDYLRQYAPLMNAQELASLIGAFPGGTNVSIGPGTEDPSPWKKALGGGMAGAAAGSTFGPWGALIGGGIGAGASLLA